MKNKTKLWLIIGTSLVLVGCIVFAVVMSIMKWDFKKLSTVKYETNTYEISEKFSNISIVTKTADIVFVPSKDLKNTVVCHEQKNLEHTVTVKDDTLVIELSDTRKWYEYITLFSFDTPEITVYIPESAYDNLLIDTSTGDIKIPSNYSFQNIDVSASTGDVSCKASAVNDMKIKLSTGHINLDNITAGSINLTTSTGDININSVDCNGQFATSVTTGDIKLENINCKDLSSVGDIGDITLKNVIATEKFSIKRDTGDVKFERCDAGEIFVTTDTGSVKGSLQSDKLFVCSTSTGKVDVPKTANGGRCEITTSTGNISIKIEK